ncbi:MAG: DUF3298 and DUF4163 domain-containing protein [Patescibacteria group bacterium]|nr:DUF3298 and DUF4163 domain-containing protein [Patescibacteria group bacterium]
MKRISFLLVALALFGAGCWSNNQNVNQNQTPTPTTTTQTPTTTGQNPQPTGLLTYKNSQQGIEFQYPATAVDVTTSTNETYAPKVIASFDLGKTVNDPEAKSVPETRLDVLKISADAKTQEGKPIINDGFYYEFGWTPQLNVGVRRETLGNYEFGRSTYSDAAAGNLYTTYAYTYPIGNNELVLFRFVIHSVNCGNYEGTGFKCIPFDATRDIQTPEQIMATVRLTSSPVASVYSFKDGTVSEKTKYVEIKATYPVMTGGQNSVTTAFNAKIKSFIDLEVAQFKKDTQSAADYPGVGPLYLNYYYNIPYNQNGLISVVMQKESFTGGAHPNTTYKTYLFNTQNSKFLVLGDLFKPTSDYLGTIASYTKSQLQAKFLKDAQQNGQTEAEWFSEGAEPKAANYENFNLTDKGINFIFPPYQVAAYAYGTQEQVVPVSIYKTSILATGPISFWNK